MKVEDRGTEQRAEQLAQKVWDVSYVPNGISDVAAIIAAALREEREACAKYVTSLVKPHFDPLLTSTIEDIAAAIRGRE